MLLRGEDQVLYELRVSVDCMDTVETYYCLWQAVGDNLVFEVEVIDPKDEQGNIQEEDGEVKA